VKPPGGADPYTLGKNVFGLTPWLSTALYHLILAGRIWWPWRRFPVEPAEVAIPNLKRYLHRDEPRGIPAREERGRLHVDRSVGGDRDLGRAGHIADARSWEGEEPVGGDAVSEQLASAPALPANLRERPQRLCSSEPVGRGQRRQDGHVGRERE